MNKNIIFYFLVATVFGVLKLFYTQADNDDILLLLLPTNKLVECLSNSIAVYSSEEGFYHHAFNMVIEKSCSGFRFFLMCFIMSYCTVLPHLKGVFQKILLLPLSLLISYVLTIFINAFRILIAIKMQYFDLSFISKSKAALHQAEGTFIYLSFFIFFYITLIFFIQKIKKNYA